MEKWFQTGMPATIVATMKEDQPGVNGNLGPVLIQDCHLRFTC